MIPRIVNHQWCMGVMLDEQRCAGNESTFGLIGAHFDGDVTTNAVRLTNASDDDAHELSLVCVEEVDADAAAR